MARICRGTKQRKCGRTFKPRHRRQYRCDRCQSEHDRERNDSSFYRSPKWRRDRKQARRRLGDECAVCGSTDRPTVHHKKGRTVGGPDDQENYTVICGSCHSQYEADVRGGRDTELRRIVDAL